MRGLDLDSGEADVGMGWRDEGMGVEGINMDLGLWNEIKFLKLCLLRRF